MFLSIHTPYSDIIKDQIAHSKISRECSRYYIFLNFTPDGLASKLPNFRDRVPIEMLVQHISEEGQQQGTIYYSHGISDQCIEDARFQNCIEPTSFLMHIYDGAARQIEVYNLDSSEINISKICVWRVNYRISSDFMLAP